MSSQNSAADRKSAIQTWQQLAAIIDHTLLRPEATADQVVRLCEEAREFSFGSVMVNSARVALAVSKMQGSGV